jgi:hypothetical protein
MGKISKHIILAIVAGFILGAVWMVALRFFTYRSHDTHYHANFALYINGVKEEFANPLFYEEVQSCSVDNSNEPKARVHMHENKNHVIHVHDNAVTWGQFFANLGYGLTNDAITTDKGVFVDGEGGALTFVLNGQEVNVIANQVIQSEDVLLVDYQQTEGEPTETRSLVDAQERYAAILKDAHEFNTKQDPATCAGSQTLSFSERLKKAISIE